MTERLLAAILGVLLMLSLSVGTTAAGEIPGQDDPAYLAALDLWLDDDEAGALNRLAELARSGNIAARMLVGLVDKDLALQGPWLALRTKPERIALLRTSGGLSGTSWLREAGDVKPAQLWLKVLDGEADIKTVLSLADLGEARAVRAGLISLESRQWNGFAEFADDQRFPDATRYLIWREWQKDGRNDAVAAALATRQPGDPQRALLGDGVPVGELESYLMQTHLAAPLTVLCHKECPASPGACMRAGLKAIGGYRRLASLGTPMAALISEQRFAASQRGRNTVLRTALSLAFLTELRIRQLARTDACFARLLADEGQRF